MAELKARYFTTITCGVALEKYGVESPDHMLADGHFWCPLFWCGLHRIAPGYASGSQSAEASHRHLLSPLLQDDEGRQIRNAEPPQLFRSINCMVRTVGQQLAKVDALEDMPTFDDPSHIAGQHLHAEGRTTACKRCEAIRQMPELHHKAQVPYVGTVVVLPRALLQRDKHHRGSDTRWTDRDLAALAISEPTARMVAEATFEKDGKRQLRLWQKLGITVGGRTRSTIKLDPARWAQLRYDHVVVLWDSAADLFWHRPAQPWKNILCCCTPFALWAGCEHQLCVRALMEFGYKLETPGQNVGGRGRTVRALMTGKAPQPAAKRPQRDTTPAAVHAEETLAAWSCASASLDARRDGVAVEEHSADAGDRDALLSDILRRAGAVRHARELKAKRVGGRALQSGFITAEMLYPRVTEARARVCTCAFGLTAVAMPKLSNDLAHVRWPRSVARTARDADKLFFLAGRVACSARRPIRRARCVALNLSISAETMFAFFCTQ